MWELRDNVTSYDAWYVAPERAAVGRPDRLVRALDPRHPGLEHLVDHGRPGHRRIACQRSPRRHRRGRRPLDSWTPRRRPGLGRRDGDGRLLASKQRLSRLGDRRGPVRSMATDLDQAAIGRRKSRKPSGPVFGCSQRQS
ncbi:hypothetical protein BCD49_35760 [Pseudofrankia sp. EUN1h]|nr:hypothetical protein BCD49_35760 [Pseudofrankia sp. EUN1h]